MANIFQTDKKNTQQTITGPVWIRVVENIKCKTDFLLKTGLKNKKRRNDFVISYAFLPCRAELPIDKSGYYMVIGCL